MPAINYLQAVAFFLLARILFSIGHHGGHSHFRRVGSAFQCRNRDDIDDGLPEDREVFRRYWREEGREAFADYMRRGQPSQDGSGAEA